MADRGSVRCWAGAAMRLKDRDAWIGWDPVTRANRLGLVVQLRRFLVPEDARRPNLASRGMGLALRELRGQWRERHGWPPLLAETFSDPESHPGTVYKVTHWTPWGMTAGFSRHRADFYRDDKHPKKLWAKELARRARGLLGSPAELPGAYRAGVVDGAAGARSPLKGAQLRSLFEAMRSVPDPRSKRSRRYPMGAMLALVALGLLAGADSVAAVWRQAGPLSQEAPRRPGAEAPRRFRASQTAFLRRDQQTARTDRPRRSHPRTLGRPGARSLGRGEPQPPAARPLPGGGRTPAGCAVPAPRSTSP